MVNWAQSNPPWRTGEPPSFAVPVGDGVIVTVPELRLGELPRSEHSFFVRLCDVPGSETDPLAYTAAGSSEGITIAVSAGQRPARLRRVGNSFFVDQWNIEMLTWQERVPVPAYPGSALAMLGDGRVLIIGGVRFAKNKVIQPARDVTLVDLGDCSVRTVEPLIQPRGGAHAFLLPQGKVLVVGGHTLDLTTEETVETAATEVFDQARGSWELGNTLEMGRIGAHIAQLSNGDVLVAGGGHGKGPDALTNCKLYEAKKERWREACPLPTGRSYGALCGLPNGRAVLSGGSGVGIEWASQATRTATVYDPVRDVWAALPSMNCDRFSPISSPVGADSVLVMGGVDRKSETVRSLEVLSLLEG